MWNSLWAPYQMYCDKLLDYMLLPQYALHYFVQSDHAFFEFVNWERYHSAIMSKFLLKSGKIEQTLANKLGEVYIQKSWMGQEN